MKFEVAEQHIKDLHGEKITTVVRKNVYPHDFPDIPHHGEEKRQRTIRSTASANADHQNDEDYHRQREDLSLPSGEECSQKVGHLQFKKILKKKKKKKRCYALIVNSAGFDFFDLVQGSDMQEAAHEALF